MKMTTLQYLNMLTMEKWQKNQLRQHKQQYETIKEGHNRIYNWNSVNIVNVQIEIATSQSVTRITQAKVVFILGWS